MDSPPVPGELLVDIFLRLTDPADLVRASAACDSFRRLVADRSFLRQYSKLHPPPLLGFLGQRGVFRPAMAPHPSASAASAVAKAADFSFSFLPAPVRTWVVMDSRDGRVLLDRPPQHDIGNRYRVVFPELVVCDPLHRRYLLLPPIPDTLAASVDDPLLLGNHRHCETFLGHAGDETTAAEETSFRVFWMAQCRTKLVAFVFSSNTGKWRAISSESWSGLFAGLPSSTELPLFSGRQYAYGCFYWVRDWRERLLVLDTQRMEFSVAESSPEASCVAIAIVEAGEGRPGKFELAEDASYLNYSISRNNCESPSQWQFEKTIYTRCSVMGSAGRHLFLYQYPTYPSFDAILLSLDIKTFRLDRVFVSNYFIKDIFAYSNFPPSLLSIPTVSSGVEKCAEKEM